ncbi:hypothetical protein RFI_16936 [Reticulomyxa filosa]|uniref:Uncharacterized protein n=1 Tax=Reticulomyxa filosa TaxID=46433 RepID=X6N2G6_RETFI|nr:hypothetical protein RFI_16936 [Reticulomyxa filosa]|eukprot:ETO20281.1 hypothetical protein RFI_16936 [Reticulomyxa filosa]
MQISKYCQIATYFARQEGIAFHKCPKEMMELIGTYARYKSEFSRLFKGPQITVSKENARQCQANDHSDAMIRCIDPIVKGGYQEWAVHLHKDHISGGSCFGIIGCHQYFDIGNDGIFIEGANINESVNQYDGDLGRLFRELHVQMTTSRRGRGRRTNEKNSSGGSNEGTPNKSSKKSSSKSGKKKRKLSKNRHHKKKKPRMIDVCREIVSEMDRFDSLPADVRGVYGICDWTNNILVDGKLLDTNFSKPLLATNDVLTFMCDWTDIRCIKLKVLINGVFYGEHGKDYTLKISNLADDDRLWFPMVTLEYSHEWCEIHF